MKSIRTLLALLPIVLLTGCLEYTEDVWVNKDGTGRLKADHSIVAGMLSDSEAKETEAELERVATTLRENPKVTEATVESSIDDGMRHFVLDVRVSDYHALSEVQQTIDASAEAKGADAVAATKSIEFKETEDGQIQFIRTLDDEAGQQRLSRSAKVNGLSANELEERDYRITFRLHGDVVHDASAPGAVDEDAKTAEWSFSIFDDTDVPPARLTATFSRESSSNTLWLVLGCVAGVLALVVLRDRWKRGLVRKSLNRWGVL